MKEKEYGILNIDAYCDATQKLKCFLLYDTDVKHGETEIIERPAINDFLFLSSCKEKGIYISKQIVISRDALWLQNNLIDKAKMSFNDFVDFMEKRNYIIDGFNDLDERISEIATFPLVERVSAEHYDRLIALDYNIKAINDLGHMWKHIYLNCGYVPIVKTARALVEAKENERVSDEVLYMLNKKLAISYMYFWAKHRMPRFECKGYVYDVFLSYDNLYKLFK